MAGPGANYLALDAGLQHSQGVVQCGIGRLIVAVVVLRSDRRTGMLQHRLLVGVCQLLLKGLRQRGSLSDTDSCVLLGARGDPHVDVLTLLVTLLVRGNQYYQLVGKENVPSLCAPAATLLSTACR